MKKKIISKIKYNKFLLSIYKFFGTIFVGFLKVFIRPNKKSILFMSYGGQKYDDSPKALYEKIKEDSFFSDYELVWAFINPEKFEVDCKKIKTDSYKFYKYALSSIVWVHNSSMERGLTLKRKGNLEINTFHGTPLKKIGLDAHSSLYGKLKDFSADIVCAQSEFEKNIFMRAFQIPEDKFVISGLPRNDSILNYDKNQINELKEKLGIDSDSKIILYAPTFREFDRDLQNACYIKPPINFDKWEEKLKGYTILFRAHYEVIKIIGVKQSSFLKDVSLYPTLNDLIAVSDLLISDYSSIYFDYAITDKPMLNYSYDYDTYLEKRGVYLNLKEDLPCNVNITEEELLQEILSLDYNQYSLKTKAFKEKYITSYNNASEKVITKIKESLEKKNV